MAKEPAAKGKGEGSLERREAFAQLVDLAKSDAQFFHSLAFDPESTLQRLDFLDRRSKGALVAIDPGELVAHLVGVTQWCGNTCSSSCDNTCGGSCGFTTNLQARVLEPRFAYYAREARSLEYCGNTCSSSCDNTCGQSCGYTTNIVGERFGGLTQFR